MCIPLECIKITPISNFINIYPIGTKIKARQTHTEIKFVGPSPLDSAGTVQKVFNGASKCWTRTNNFSIANLAFYRLSCHSTWFSVMKKLTVNAPHITRLENCLCYFLVCIDFELNPCNQVQSQSVCMITSINEVLLGYQPIHLLHHIDAPYQMSPI